MKKSRVLTIALMFVFTVLAFNNCSSEQFPSEFSKVTSDLVVSSSMYVQSLSSNAQDETVSIQNTNEAQTVNDIDCTATDLNSWKACVGKANSQQINRINVTGPIFCSDGSCALSLSSLSQFKIIASGQGVFVRSGGYEAPLFKFVSVNFLTVTGVKVFEPVNRPVQLQPGQEEHNSLCLALPGKKCASTLEVYGGQSVQVSGLYLENGKIFNAIFWGIDDLRIDQSRFDKAFLFGIWGAENKRISLTNSIFQKNRSNAFLISFSKTDQAVISGNIFDNNHHATAFHVCGDSRQEPCPGGQIDLVEQVSNVTIDKNVFLNSRLSGEFPEDLKPNLVITSIEFEPHSATISRVKIDANYYENNSAGMLYLNMPSAGAFENYKSDVLVSNNNYCQTPGALFNFAPEYQWKSQVQYLNNQERCISGLKSVPAAPAAPRDQSSNLSYSWQAGEWGTCSAKPAFVYSDWTDCVNENQRRTVQCSGQSGQQIRQIRCVSSEGDFVSDSLCSVNLRPSVSQSCSQSCTGIPQLARTCSTASTVVVAPPSTTLRGSLSGTNCQVQPGQSTCTTIIRWAAEGLPGACVFANGALFACQGEISSKSAAWITEEGILFELKTSNQASSKSLATQKIYAVSPYTLAGTNCQLDGKTTCTSVISWKAPGFPTACVFVDGALFACEGENSSKVAPWIPAGEVTFELRQNSSVTSPLLKRLVVRGR